MRSRSLRIGPIGGGTGKRITGDNKGWDGNPVYSPDGKSIAFLSQERAGFGTADPDRQGGPG